MKDLEILLSLTATVIGLLITILTFIVKSVKNAKVKKGLEQAMKIGNAILPFIQEAEKFTAFTGPEKKAYVMTKANQFALTNHLSFNEPQISVKVEELVALTKQVNVTNSAKDKEEIVNETNQKVSQKSWL